MSGRNMAQEGKAGVSIGREGDKRCGKAMAEEDAGAGGRDGEVIRSMLFDGNRRPIRTTEGDQWTALGWRWGRLRVRT